MTIIVPMGALGFAYGPNYTYINTHYNSLGFSPFPLSLLAAPHQTLTLSIFGRFSGQSTTTAASELTPPPPHSPLSHPRSFDILHALQFSPKHIFCSSFGHEFDTHIISFVFSWLPKTKVGRTRRSSGRSTTFGLKTPRF